MNDAETAVAYLRSPLAIRARCENILEAGFADRLAHFAIDLHAMPGVVDEVVTVTRAHYPSLAIPVHGRVNHSGPAASIESRRSMPSSPRLRRPRARTRGCAGRHAADLSARPAGRARRSPARECAARELPAPELLRVLLVGLASIWPGRETLGGHNLGDV